ncbi:MAG: hypothetical protein H6715_01410 [Myxococcales bacterium]|nr:hypothetical protein [Myxococcales bacterium]MCB9708953.1 hypothetical protein [Myxococcales bacterium]
MNYTISVPIVSGLALACAAASGCASRVEMQGDTDQSGQAPPITTTCGNLGDSKGYNQDQLFCYRALDPLPTGCDKSWTDGDEDVTSDDNQWVCDTFLEHAAPSPEWKILNQADNGDLAPTVLGDDIECDLCMGYAPGGQHPSARETVLPEYMLDGYWRLTTLFGDGIPMFRLKTHQGKVEIFQCVVWGGNYQGSVEVGNLWPTKIQCNDLPAVTGAVAQRAGIPEVNITVEDKDDISRPTAELWNGVAYDPDTGALNFRQDATVLKVKFADHISDSVINHPVEPSGDWDVIAVVANEIIARRSYHLALEGDSARGDLVACEDKECSPTITVIQSEDPSGGYHMDVDLGEFPLSWIFINESGTTLISGETRTINGSTMITPGGMLAFCEDFSVGNGLLWVRACLTPSAKVKPAALDAI